MSARQMLDRFGSSERAASAVEFALSILPLVVLIVGSVDLGRALYIKNDLARVADVGARVILLDSTVADANVESVVRNAFRAADGAGIEVALGSESAGGHAFRTISLRYPVDLLAPVPGIDRITVGDDRRVPVN